MISARYDLTTEAARLPGGTFRVLRVDCDNCPVRACCLGLLEASTLNFFILFAGLAADTLLWTWNLTQVLRLW
jgi:hypothetical protein